MMTKYQTALLSYFVLIISCVSKNRSKEEGNPPESGLHEYYEKFSNDEMDLLDSVIKYNLKKSYDSCLSVMYLGHYSDTLGYNKLNQFVTVGEVDFRLARFKRDDSLGYIFSFIPYYHDSIPCYELKDDNSNNITSIFYIDTLTHLITMSVVDNRYNARILNLKEIMDSNLKSEQFKDYVRSNLILLHPKFKDVIRRNRVLGDFIK